MKPIRLASAIRGLYGRVADKAGVDPSYVSRIAQGERKSKAIEKVLNREIHKILALIGNASPVADKRRTKRSEKKGPPKAIKDL
jgi:hypothetical protein